MTAAFAHGVVALVLMEDGGHGPVDPVVAVGFVEIAAPVIRPVAGDSFAELRSARSFPQPAAK